MQPNNKPFHKIFPALTAALLLVLYHSVTVRIIRILFLTVKYVCRLLSYYILRES